MARITVEDCVIAVPNRFELVHLAARRARELSQGAEPAVSWDNDKNTIIALREIGDRAIDPATISEAIIHTLRNIVDEDLLPEEPEEPQESLLEMEAPSKAFNWNGGGADDDADYDDDYDDDGIRHPPSDMEDDL